MLKFKAVACPGPNMYIYTVESIQVVIYLSRVIS